MGFRGSNASGGRIVLLPSAFWAHGASKMATLGASLLLCVSQCFRAYEGMFLQQARVARAVLTPGALFRAGAFAFPPCAPRSHMRLLPHFRVSDIQRVRGGERGDVKFLLSSSQILRIRAPWHFLYGRVLWVLWGCRTIIARYLAKWVSHRCACVSQVPGGYRTILGSC